MSRIRAGNNSDCGKNDPKMRIICVSNSSCHSPSTAVSFVQDSMPLRCLCEVKQFAEVCLRISSHMVILLENFCIVLLFAFMAEVFLVRNKLKERIERRFYEEGLSPDLKWHKQASTRFCRLCLLEALYLHKIMKYLNRHPNLHTQTS